MRYGYCTGFATPVKDRIDFELLADIKAAGYDYAEFPVALIERISEDAFLDLLGWLKDNELGADAACNLFPPSIRLTGAQARIDEAADYLDRALPRADKLGARTIVFGSSGARNLPSGTSEHEGYEQLIAFVQNVLTPRIKAHGMQLVMEPIGSYEDNFLNTLPDGMRVVDAVDDPAVALLADSVHMLYEAEDPAHIGRYAPYLKHVHLCEAERALPVSGYSPALGRVLDALGRIGYDRAVSFEPMPYPRADMKKALQTLKRRMSEQP